MKKIVIIGGGVIGITTAYTLAKQGHAVTVVERHNRAATEASFGNGGLISPSDSAAWGSPDAVIMALKSLVKPNNGIQYKFQMNPGFWLWSLQFLGQCTKRANWVNTRNKFELAQFSQICFRKIVDETGIEFNRQTNGVLMHYPTEAAFAEGIKFYSRLEKLGLRLEVLNRVETLALEPRLEASIDGVAGSVLSPECESGDSHAFANNLANYSVNNFDVALRYGTICTGFESRAEKILAVSTDKGPITADAYVLCAGAYSPLLAEKIGIRLPICPVKGFSITAQLDDPSMQLNRAVVDENNQVVVTPFGDHIRVSSSALFTGYDTSTKPEDFTHAKKIASAMFDGKIDLERASHWTGFRPMTPTGHPLIGETKFNNLFLNTGHGHLGWTFSCGSAERLSMYFTL